MTRMYVVLAIMFGVVSWAGALLGQHRSNRSVDDHDAFLQKRLQLREEMHRRMMDKLLRGIGPDQNMFSDMEKMMDDIMADSFTGPSISGSLNTNFSMEWSESTAGRTLVLKPQDPSQNLDIDVANGFITIKGKVEHKNGQSISVSQFNNSFNVPGDCDETKVKLDQKDGKILVFFPFKVAAKEKPLKPKQNERRPIGPGEEDVHI